LKDKKYEDGMHVSEALGHYFKALGMDDKMLETRVLSQWKSLMGEAVAVRTKAIYIRDQILYLTINSSVVRDELSQEKSEIIDKLNACAGKMIVKEIYFK
jgi:predicted nucleic acid-binding Zn ribbon protein